MMLPGRAKTRRAGHVLESGELRCTMSDTALAYGALRTCYAMSGTRISYGNLSNAMRCPALAYRMAI
eukprot:3563811-Rhodomonas_salina.3